MLQRRDRRVLRPKLEGHAVLELQLIRWLVPLDRAAARILVKKVESRVERVVPGKGIREVPRHIAAGVFASLPGSDADSGVFAPRLLRDGVGHRNPWEFACRLRLRTAIDAIPLRVVLPIAGLHVEDETLSPLTACHSILPMP